MGRAYTKEEKIQFLDQALNNYTEAQRLIDEACTLMKRCGVSMCGNATSVYDNAYEEDASKALFVYSGIRKLAKLLDQSTRHPLDIFRENRDHSRIGVIRDGVLFFQLGDAQSSCTKYHYR